MKIETDPNTKHTVYRCESWDEFIKEQRKLAGRSADGHLFRGHAQSVWTLSSRLERTLIQQRAKNPDKSIEVLRNEIREGPLAIGNLDRFKDLAIGLPGFDSKQLANDDEWLALGRHSGLITDLLDWSRSPFVAAFFAYWDAFATANQPFDHFAGTLHLPLHPVAIWALAEDRRIQASPEFEFVYARPPNNYFQRAQRGVFTRLRSNQHLDLHSYLIHKSLGQWLEKWEISFGDGSEPARALRDLHQMNISFGTIFPDLRGAALEANFGSSLQILGGY